MQDHPHEIGTLGWVHIAHRFQVYCSETISVSEDGWEETRGGCRGRLKKKKGQFEKDAVNVQSSHFSGQRKLKLGKREQHISLYRKWPQCGWIN